MVEPLRAYDYLTRARRRVLDWARPLSAEQYGRQFPIGLGTLGRTLTHILICEWYYVERMLRHEVPPYEQWPMQDEKPPPFPALERAWTEQGERTRAAIAAVRDWNGPIEYRNTSDDGRPEIITASAADIFTQLVLHEVHHRAQVLNMLRQMEVRLEDIDFNAFMYTRRAAT